MTNIKRRNTDKPAETMPNGCRTAAVTVREAARLTVQITPLNEGQEINYAEQATGEPEALISRAVEILDGLTALLPKGSFAVKIENLYLDDAIFIKREESYDENFNLIQVAGQVYDKDWNLVGSLDEIIKHFSERR